jgi:hypothetical protein
MRRCLKKRRRHPDEHTIAPNDDDLATVATSTPEISVPANDNEPTATEQATDQAPDTQLVDEPAAVETPALHQPANDNQPAPETANDNSPTPATEAM